MGRYLSLALSAENSAAGVERNRASGVRPKSETTPFPPVNGSSRPSLDTERSFGQPHARLFSFIGHKVRTPQGPGTLLQVFAERVTVVLDSERSKCAIFLPAEIEPASKDDF